MKRSLSVVALSLAATASPALAAPVLVAVGADLASAPYSFSIGSDEFTFLATGDIFNPVAVQTSGTAAVNSFGGFLGIPLNPTTNFVDRGTVTFGPGMNFDPFPTATTIPFSNSDNFIGLRATVRGENYYGFAYTTDTVFNGYGFESTPGVAITATTALAAAVPEPTSWAMMVIGLGVIGAAMRRRQAVQLRHAPTRFPTARRTVRAA